MIFSLGGKKKKKKKRGSIWFVLCRKSSIILMSIFVLSLLRQMFCPICQHKLKGSKVPSSPFLTVFSAPILSANCAGLMIRKYVTALWLLRLKQLWHSHLCNISVFEINGGKNILKETLLPLLLHWFQINSSGNKSGPSIQDSIILLGALKNVLISPNCYYHIKLQMQTSLKYRNPNAILQC